MSALLTPVVQVTVIAATGLLAAHLLRRRSAAVRHAVLAASLACTAVAPLARLALPGWSVASPLAVSTSEQLAAKRSALMPAVDGARALEAGPDEEPRPDWMARGAVLLVMLWAGGTLVSASRLAGGVRRVQRATRHGRVLAGERWDRLLLDLSDARTNARVTLCVVAGVPAPATWGTRRARVLLPPQAEGWSDERLRLAVAHELAHVARRDWITQLAAEVVRAVYWWHPLVQRSATRLRLESELACDDRVLAVGVAACDYAAHLVAVARTVAPTRRGAAGTLAMAHPPQLERRIVAMLTHRHDRRPLMRGHAMALALAATSFTAVVATVHTQPSQADLRGTVFDSSGAVVPEVALALVRADDTRLEAFTRADGSFSFPAIAAGTYTLEAALPGFAKLSETFTLASASDWDRAITLQLGTLQETISIVADRTATVAPAEADGPVRLRVGGNIRVPRKLKDVRAVYPPAMRAEGREGEVNLEAVIDVEGAVQSVRVLGAHVHPDFALAAADAVRQWRFSPTLLNGQPVEVRMNVSMSFTLGNGAGQ